MKKILWIVMVILLMTCLLCGCGSGGKQPEPTPSPTPSPTAVPTPTPTPTPIPFDTVVESVAASCTAAADEAAVYGALSEAWTVAEERIEYGGEDALPLPAENRVVTLYADGTAGSVDMNSVVTDGNYLYMLSGTTLRILKADGANTVQLATVEVGSGWSDTQENGNAVWGGFEKYPSRLYLSGTRLAVICDWYGYDAYTSNGADVCDYTSYTCVDIYELTDPVAPVLVSSLGQDGIFRSAELSDGLFYLATEHHVYSDAQSSDSASFLPQLYNDGVGTSMSAGDVYLPEAAADGIYAVVSVYDLAAGTQTSAKAVLGVNADMIVSAPSVYLLSERYAHVLSRSWEENIYTVSDYADVACTDVYRLELKDNALTVAASGSVVGHLAGERSAAVLEDALHLAAREENFRYAVYLDSQHGFENVLWGELESGDSSYVLSPELKEQSDAAFASVYEGYLFSWQNGGYIGLSQTETGALKLSVLSGDGTETASKTFGNDYSKTLSSADSIYVNGEKNIIGFAADDGYSFYQCTEEGELAAIFDAYITDWPWHVRCLSVGDFLYMADQTTLYIYSLTDMALAHTLTF